MSNLNNEKIIIKNNLYTNYQTFCNKFNDEFNETNMNIHQQDDCFIILKKLLKFILVLIFGSIYIIILLLLVLIIYYVFGYIIINYIKYLSSWFKKNWI